MVLALTHFSLRKTFMNNVHLGLLHRVPADVNEIKPHLCIIVMQDGVPGLSATFTLQCT